MNYFHKINHFRCVTALKFTSEFINQKKKKKKHLGLIVKLVLNTQIVFTCSKSGLEPLEKVSKYVQSLYF